MVDRATVCDTGIPKWKPVSVLAALLLIKFPISVPGKSTGQSPSTWVPVTHMGEQRKSLAPDSAW